MRLLQQEVFELQKQVAEFEEALEVLLTRPKYAPQPGQLAPLDFLRVELSSLETEEERKKLLTMAQKSLENAKASLAVKQGELGQLEADCSEIALKMKAAGEAVLTAQSEFRECLRNFEDLASQYQRRWSELNPNRDLYQKSWQNEYPGFALINGCGILTTAAIASDLRRKLES